VGAAPRRINLPHLYSHTGEMMATCVIWSFRMATWSSRHSSDLARSVSRCVVGLHWRPGQDVFSRARMLVRRWWICRSSLTSLMRGGGSWSKITHGHPPVIVPQRHVPRYVQQVHSSTHKALLAVVLCWIWQWWRLSVSFGVRLGARFGQRPVALVVA
jgi:hypothetical protein